MNYTQEQTEYMVEQYKNKPSRITVDRLAKELDKSPKSIIGKLSREGVYRRSVYKTKTGETPVTKTELVEELAYIFELNPAVLAGLEKAPKNVLKVLKGVATGSQQ